ncbi:MAG TPA: histidine triad nucleotide-binding protein [Gemmatimonadetes bacterium]|nr:histidine triad nucleotide-binding protein [Gemmatimonadota bacterium]
MGRRGVHCIVRPGRAVSLPVPNRPSGYSSRKEPRLSDPNCLFCRIVRGEIPATIVYQDDQLVAFRDINPQAPTHILIIPHEHVATLNELVPSQGKLMGHMHLLAQALARAEGIAESGWRVVINCGADAGQSVFHVHMHVLGGRSFGWPPG